MKKNAIKQRLGAVVDKTVKKAMSTDPSSLGVKTASGAIKVGNVTIKKNKEGADILVGGKVIHEGIKNGNALQGIVNRLASNRKTKDIPAILKLESEYVKKKNDLLFMKHHLSNNKNNFDDAEIREHRMAYTIQIIEDIDRKLYTYKNI